MPASGVGETKLDGDERGDSQLDEVPRMVEGEPAGQRPDGLGAAWGVQRGRGADHRQRFTARPCGVFSPSHGANLLP